MRLILNFCQMANRRPNRSINSVFPKETNIYVLLSIRSSPPLYDRGRWVQRIPHSKGYDCTSELVVSHKMFELFFELSRLTFFMFQGRWVETQTSTPILLSSSQNVGYQEESTTIPFVRRTLSLAMDGGKWLKIEWFSFQSSICHSICPGKNWAETMVSFECT